MAWRDQNQHEYDPHGGRNAFRNTHDDYESSSDRAASFRAMRSFTESIECDLPPAPELPPQLDIDQISMKTSDTNDTIIEVIKPTSSVDPSLGETQKYKMSVPGPGHSEQEHELHKSLIRDDDDDLDGEIGNAMVTVPSEKRAQPSVFIRGTKDPEHAALRSEYSNSALQRPRPVTPTSSCALETLAFIGGEGGGEIREERKIKVSIPSKERSVSRRRKSEMSHSEFYDSMISQLPPQARGVVSGRTTPLNDYDGDILEENPRYKDKAPPHPVVHRRTSIEWENFEDMKDRMELGEKSLQAEPEFAKKPKFEISSTRNSTQEEDEPTFSEDMSEERRKFKSAKLSNDESQTSNLVHADIPDSTQIKSMNTNEHVVPDISFSTAALKTLSGGHDDLQNEQVNNCEQATDARKLAEQDTKQEESYDPHGYPGYIWNYEAQQWEIDPNYDPEHHTPAKDYVYSDSYEYSQQTPNTGEQQQYGYTQRYDSQAYYDDTQRYSQAPYGSVQNAQYQSGYPNTDQRNGEYDQSTTRYDENSSGGIYDQNLTAYNYDQTGYGYDQTTTGYGYDQTTTGYGYDQTTTGYGYDQTTTGYGYDQNTAGYGYDQNMAYDQATPRFDEDPINYTQTKEYKTTVETDQEKGEYDLNAERYPHSVEYDQNTAAPDSNQGSDPNYQYDSVNYAYNQQHHHEYPQSAADGTQHQGVEYSYDQNDQEKFPDYTMYPQSIQYENYHQNQSSVSTVPDPYSWDTQESVRSLTSTQIEEQETSSINSKQIAPNRPPPPSRPAPPKLSHTGEHEIASSTSPSRPPPVSRPPPPRITSHETNSGKVIKEAEPEEDAWTQFKKMTEKVNDVVKSTEDRLKTLSETTAANEIADESYLADVGGSQGIIYASTHKEIRRKMEEQKNEKLLKKKLKQQGKKVASPTYDPSEEESMDRAAQELALKMASMRTDLEDWKPPSGVIHDEELERKDSLSAIPPRKRSSLKDVQQDSGGSLELPAHLSTQAQDSITPMGDLAPDDPKLSAPAWTDFDTTAPELPPSESGFFSNKDGVAVAEPSSENIDPFAVSSEAAVDPFIPTEQKLIEDDYDPFAVRPVEDIVAAAKAKAEEARLAKEAQDDLDFFGGGRHSPALSTPTPEGGSPISHRPVGFEDDFKCEGMDLETPTPLYDEDDSEPLKDFIPKFDGDGWELMIRHPIKKKSFMVERYWKPCYVRLHGTTLLLYNNKTDGKPIQELLLQATYSLSDTTLQAYDVYGKIHTVKLQYVLYKEKVGIRPGQISRLVEGHITKYGLPLEHSAQCTVLLKFGSLNAVELQSFVSTIEDILFKCPAKRDTKPVYKQDEVQVHCYDEYSAYVDKDGLLSDQKARVRLFCLAFVTGSPILEIGLNDRRRQGKEIVRRKDILPMYTERWIRFENLEFHSTVDKEEFDREQVIRLSPPDGCFFEIMRFRIRPPRNREKALTIKAIMKIAGSKVEIRIEAMAAAQIEKSKGGKSTRRQIPCEDIAIRFPVPEAWIYIFREERHWGVGSVHSKKLRPGKVKNLKDRLLGAVQSNEYNLIECAIGEAKYEHVYRSLVWRIPRLPEKHHAAYKAHLLKCRFELSSFDLMPETFLPRCEVDFTMPLATMSNTVVRSVSIEQHEDSDRVEKFVRYVAKCQYKVEIDYIQCADLEIDTMDPSINPDAEMATVPELHQPAFQPAGIAQLHDGYRIDFHESETGLGRKDDSSSDEDEEKAHKVPIIQIDMKNYGY